MSTKLFNDMLNEHLAYDLLKPEIEEKSYLWKTLEHDESWTGDLIVPFQSARASSVKAGGLVAVSDITSAKYVRGSIPDSARPEINMSLVFNHKDIYNHEGKLKAKSFLGTFLPDQITQSTDFFAKTLNHTFLNAKNLDKVTDVTNLASGKVGVDRIERFEIDMKLVLDPAGANVTAWVKTIDINASEIALVTTKGGSTAATLTGVAVGELIYQDGFAASTVNNLKELLLPTTITSGGATGSANIYGQVKTASPYTQALAFNCGSGTYAMTTSNVLEKIFDMFVKYRQLGKVGAAEVWVPFSILGHVMKQLEVAKGAYKMVEGSMKVSQYGFTEIEVFGPKGSLKIVAHQEMDKDFIVFVAKDAMKIHSNGGIYKHKDPNGNAYHTVRDENDNYKYVVDLMYEGTIVVSKPYKCAIGYGITI
ncbi:hypothetical protein D3C87_125040 [compost metagenome]